MDRLTKTEVKIPPYGGFFVYHDLPNVGGLAIDDAVHNWYFRTQDYSAESLIAYVKSKAGDSQIIMTEEDYESQT